LHDADRGQRRPLRSREIAPGEKRSEAGTAPRALSRDRLVGGMRTAIPRASGGGIVDAVRLWRSGAMRTGFRSTEWAISFLSASRPRGSGGRRALVSARPSRSRHLVDPRWAPLPPSATLQAAPSAARVGDTQEPEAHQERRGAPPYFTFCFLPNDSQTVGQAANRRERSRPVHSEAHSRSGCVLTAGLRHVLGQPQRGQRQVATSSALWVPESGQIQSKRQLQIQIGRAAA